MGQHTAILIGLSKALGEWCVVLDQDLQDPPEVIPTLLRVLNTSDVVFAGRHGRYQSFGRTLSGRLYRSLLSSLVGVPGDAGVFVVIRRAAVEQLLDLRVETISFVAMIGLADLVSCSHPINRSMQEGTTYTTRLRVEAGLRMLRCVAEERLRLVRDPIRVRIEQIGRELEIA
jgi:glycosyltransferase involved in cell wall biosynthesis